MIELTGLMRTVTRITLLFMSVCCLAWAFLPGYASTFGGLAAGLAAGLVNASHLAWRVNKLAGHAASTKYPRRAPIGFLFRASVALLAALLATKFFRLSLAAVIAGLIMVPLVTLAAGFLLSRKKASAHPIGERGEK